MLGIRIKVNSARALVSRASISAHLNWSAQRAGLLICKLVGTLTPMASCLALGFSLLKSISQVSQQCFEPTYNRCGLEEFLEFVEGYDILLALAANVHNALLLIGSEGLVLIVELPFSIDVAIDLLEIVFCIAIDLSQPVGSFFLQV